MSDLGQSTHLTATPDWRDRVLRAFFRRHWRGLYPLHRLLRPDGYIRCRARYGAELLLSTQEYVEGFILRDGYYETEVIEALRPFLAPDLVFWDIGANIGLHTVTAARLCPGLTIHAFEANPATAARLRQHVQVNATAIQVHDFALSDYDGTADFLVSRAGNTGRSQLAGGQQPPAGTSITVPVHRADTLVKSGKVPAPDLLKIDVEGFEENVLRGCGALLHSPKLRAVVFEAEIVDLASARRTPAAALLLDAGFELRALTRREATAHSLSNLLAVRS